MNIRIKRAHPAARLPAYATGGAACFDLPLARYEPDTVYIGNGEYVAECVRADDGDYYLAADVDAAIEALRVERDALLDALRQIAEWPDGGNRYGQENIKRFAQAAIDAAMQRAGEEAVRKMFGGGDVR